MSDREREEVCLVSVFRYRMWAQIPAFYTQWKSDSHAHNAAPPTHSHGTWAAVTDQLCASIDSWVYKFGSCCMFTFWPLLKKLLIKLPRTCISHPSSQLKEIFSKFLSFWDIWHLAVTFSLCLRIPSSWFIFLLLSVLLCRCLVSLVLFVSSIHSPIEETSLGYVSWFDMIFFSLHLADGYLSDMPCGYVTFKS